MGGYVADSVEVPDGAVADRVGLLTSWTSEAIDRQVAQPICLSHDASERIVRVCDDSVGRVLRREHLEHLPRRSVRVRGQLAVGVGELSQVAAAAK